jgi:hypothetical protein
MRYILLAIFLSACSPTPFVTGDEVAPPSGCAAAHSRGVNC